MKKRYVKWLVLLAAGFALVMAACSSKDERAQPVASQQQEQPAASQSQDQPMSAAQQQEPAKASATASVPMEITGLVEQTDSGYVIATKVFDYHVAEQDLSALVGKTIKATGTVQENEGKYTIVLDSVSEMDVE